MRALKYGTLGLLFMVSLILLFCESDSHSILLATKAIGLITGYIFYKLFTRFAKNDKLFQEILND